jgi:hypothetical protein
MGYPSERPHKMDDNPFYARNKNLFLFCRLSYKNYVFKIKNDLKV